MARAVKVARETPGVKVTLTPRALIRYHMSGGGYTQWEYGLGWFELHSHWDAHKKKYDAPQLKFFHFMHSDILSGAEYHKFPGHENRYVRPMDKTVKTTASDFEKYLRRKVWATKVASAQVFTLLGLVKPKQSPVAASAETNDSLIELYARVAAVMGLAVEDVRKKYEHLNPGLQAMNLRNRLRARGQNV